MNSAEQGLEAIRTLPIAREPAGHREFPEEAEN
jgi:hypothetical protein